MSYWNSSPFLTQLVRSAPGILQKIYRPYLTNRLRCNDRVDTLIGHYTFIIRQGMGPMVLRAAQVPVLLGELAGKSGGAYQIRLAAATTLETEGELALQISKDCAVLYSVAFTFTAAPGMRTLTIGCLQGPRGPDALDRVRNATRDLFGLRPKNLLLRLVTQIAHKTGCEEVVLVSNGNRVLVHQARKGLVFADYDTTWKEIGAVRGRDCDFRLSCKTVALPDMDTVESRKRSEARKRFALIDHAGELIWAALQRKPFSLAPEIDKPAETSSEAVSNTRQGIVRSGLPNK